MESVEAIRKAQRGDGPATVLAIGTAVPDNCVDQDTFADYYFRVTKNEHMTELKEKMKRMCAKSTIKRRYLYLTEEILTANPNMCIYDAHSLNVRHEMLVVEIPKIGKVAAVKAIAEWGRDKSEITHLIFCSMGGVDTPGADFQLVQLLGLNPSIKRFVMYQQGCFAGATVMRLAKDLAENNRGARVLIVCSELTIATFRGPNETEHFDNLLGQVLFGDGAAAVVIGADPVVGVEKPLFEMVLANQTILPESGDAIVGHLKEQCLTFHLLRKVPEVVANNIEKSLEEVFKPLGISDWNSLFWIIHPGGPAVLTQVEAKLNLKPDKFQLSRQITTEYGNISSATVLFVMDEMRRTSRKKGLRTTGEGLDWGVLIGLGPGITLETVVLRSILT